jgi:hypothetical protein
MYRWLLPALLFSACFAPTKAGDVCGTGTYGKVTSEVPCPDGLVCRNLTTDSESFEMRCVARSCDAGTASDGGTNGACP